MSSPTVPAANVEPTDNRETELPLTDAQREFARVLGDALADACESQPRSNAGSTPPADLTPVRIPARCRKKL